MSCSPAAAPETDGPGGPAGPTVLDALSLLAQVADELVVRSARDTHLAIADRVHGAVRRCTGGASVLPEAVHRGIAVAVYAGLGAGLRATSAGLDTVAATGLGPRLEDDPRGRVVSSILNGLIGDRLVHERPQLAIPMALRVGGRDVEPTASGLAAAYPDAGGCLVVLLHGLFEHEGVWDTRRDQTGTSYAERLAEQGWTPLLLRANTGVSVRANGVALAALLQRVVDRWPTEVSRIALVGHSLGGLVLRAAGAVDTAQPTVGDPPDRGGRVSWVDLVSDVVTLGTPHLGAPIAWGIGHGSRGLGVLPETAAFGRVLDWRSRGVHDLVAGLTDDVASLPHARYRLVAATLSASELHPVGDLVGDLLVRPRSAYGRDRHGRTLFPEAEVLHVGGTDHFGLLNHPDVLAALERWLAQDPPGRPGTPESAVGEQRGTSRGTVRPTG